MENKFTGYYCKKQIYFVNLADCKILLGFSGSFSEG